jgi:hypothetical protein
MLVDHLLVDELYLLTMVVVDLSTMVVIGGVVTIFQEVVVVVP